MKKVTLLTNAGIAGVIAATTVAAPVFACKPVGGIIKEVQDQTIGSQTADANNATSAVSVNTGDVLAYTVTVKNSGSSASNGDNDMTNVVLTDTLPSGVQLISDANQTAISEQLGTIKPGASVTKTYLVKVTSTKDGDTISNTACYTGNSKDNKDNQKGCDTAVVKVKTSTTPATATPSPTPTPTPTAPTTPSAPLPNTGSTGLTASLVALGAVTIGYALNVLRLKFRGNA